MTTNVLQDRQKQPQETSSEASAPKQSEANAPLNKPRRNNRTRRRNNNSNNNSHRNDKAQEQPKKYHGMDDQRNPASNVTASIPTDENLPPNLPKDPRGEDPSHRMTKATKGRNTESFDPSSTLVRPDIRVLVGLPTATTYKKPLKHDDVVIVPDLFGPEDDWNIYYKLVEEMTQLQLSQVKGSEWISWHEGSHLIARNPPTGKSATFTMVIDKLCDYFSIQKQSIGTRLNWYKDSSDWKPFHHDSAYVRSMIIQFGFCS